MKKSFNHMSWAYSLSLCYAMIFKKAAKPISRPVVAAEMALNLRKLGPSWPKLWLKVLDPHIPKAERDAAYTKLQQKMVWVDASNAENAE